MSFEFVDSVYAEFDMPSCADGPLELDGPAREIGRSLADNMPLDRARDRFAVPNGT